MCVCVCVCGKEVFDITMPMHWSNLLNQIYCVRACGLLFYIPYFCRRSLLALIHPSFIQSIIQSFIQSIILPFFHSGLRLIHASTIGVVLKEKNNSDNHKEEPMEIMIIVKKDTDLEEHSKNKRATTKQRKKDKWNLIFACFVFFLNDCFNFVSCMNF